MRTVWGNMLGTGEIIVADDETTARERDGDVYSYEIDDEGNGTPWSTATGTATP